MLGLILLGGLPAAARAQRRLTLDEAVAAALASGPRVAIARADSAAARAAVLTARAYPNPDLAFDYTKDPPHQHLILEQPFEYPWARSARRTAAERAADAATYTLEAERAALRYQVQAAYAGAAAALEVRRLSERNARDGAELLRITRARQQAGDASELDVELAAVEAGQLRSAALADSADAVVALLELQTLIGLPMDRVEVALADSLDALPARPAAPPPLPLRVAAAELQLRSEQARLALARRRRLPAPSLRAGVEHGDPEGETGLLPTFGVSLPIPIFDRGRGGVAEARAAAERARAELAAARRESAAALALAERARTTARERVARDRLIVRDAERVSALSLTAYREGAYPLASVLEAQRNARDALRQYVTDLATSRTAEAAWLLAGTSGERP